MALTEYQRKVMKAIKEQWWTADDFRAWLSSQKEPKEVTEAPEVVEEPTLEEKETVLAEEIAKEEPTIDPKIAGSKARQQLAEEWITEEEPWILSRVWKWVTEAIIWEEWEDTLLEKWMTRVVESNKPWDFDITEPLKAIEWWVQIAWWVIKSWLEAGWTLIWELLLRPGLETLSPETLQKVWDISSIPWDAVKSVIESTWWQAVLNLINKWTDLIPDNLKDDAEALLNIFWVKAFVSKAPWTWKVIAEKIPWTKIRQAKIAEVATQELRDTGRALLSLPSKIDQAKWDELLKFFANNAKATKNFDKLVNQFDDLWISSINTLDKWLKLITKTFKPAWAKEVLNEMIKNVDKIKWLVPAWTKKTLNELLKKLNTEWLTLTEINWIKRNINHYTKGWTKSWLEWSWLKAEWIRGKYSEVRKFIENTAAKNWITDVAELNKAWINSNELSEYLYKQAVSVSKKKGMETLTKPGILIWLWEKARDIYQTPFRWLFREVTKKWIMDIDLEDAINIINKLWQEVTPKSILNILKKK